MWEAGGGSWDVWDGRDGSGVNRGTKIDDMRCDWKSSLREVGLADASTELPSDSHANHLCAENEREEGGREGER